MSPQAPIYVLGCGIIGLTTAIRLQESSTLSAPVHILASTLPSDPPHPAYASTAAGAHHLSFADNEDSQQRWMDARTFEVMWRELEQRDKAVGEGEKGEPIGLMKLVQTEYFDGEEKHLDFFEGMPEFRIRSQSEIPSHLPATHSIQFTSLTMTPAIYLQRLYSRFLANGGQVHRVHLTHLDQAVTFIPTLRPKALVVCLGLGALSLAGLADTSVFPTRGQVLVLDLPWCTEGFTFQQGQLKGGEGGRRRYVIPRSNGEVIVGGTRDIDDWNVNARPETSTAILEGVLALAGAALFPPGTPTSQQTVEALRKRVKAEVVGWRPTRRDGVRVENMGAVQIENEAKVPVVANYGHGGFGWQSCWGSAELAVELLGREKAPKIYGKLARCLGAQEPVRSKL